MRNTLFVLSILVLCGFWLGLKWLMKTKYGRVLQAIRDAENRTQFLGYSTLGYKLSAWVLSAVMCGIAGALYVPQVGIINPGEMAPAQSIEMVIWVAVGGRGTLSGPILGAYLVSLGKSWMTVLAPEYWLHLLGALFIAVTLFLPKGITGMMESFFPTDRTSKLGKE